MKKIKNIAILLIIGWFSLNNINDKLNSTKNIELINIEIAADDDLKPPNIVDPT